MIFRSLILLATGIPTRCVVLIYYTYVYYENDNIFWIDDV